MYHDGSHVHYDLWIIEYMWTSGSAMHFEEKIKGGSRNFMGKLLQAPSVGGFTPRTPTTIGNSRLFFCFNKFGKNLRQIFEIFFSFTIEFYC